MVYFRYVGRTGLTVVGPITGTRYRFDRNGAVIPVDAKDGRSLAAIANLRRVAAPARATSGR